MSLGALTLLAAALLPQGIQVPAPRGYVNDFANVLPPASEARIERTVDDVREKSGGEIVVVTLPDPGRHDVADVAREIGRQWRVGKAGKPGDPARNTGVVVLVVPKETSSDGRGHFRIETGTGAEGLLPDGLTGRIQDEALPILARRDYGAALELTVRRIAERYAEEFHFTLASAGTPEAGERLPREAPARPSPEAPAGGGIPFGVLLIAFIFLIFLFNWLSAARGRRRRGCAGCLPVFLPLPGGGYGGWGGFPPGGFGGRGFGGRGFGGDFGGFGGGGGFAGGGSSRSW